VSPTEHVTVPARRSRWRAVAALGNYWRRAGLPLPCAPCRCCQRAQDVHLAFHSPLVEPPCPTLPARAHLAERFADAATAATERRFGRSRPRARGRHLVADGAR